MRQRVQRLWAANPLLTLVGLVFLAGFVLCLGGLALDPRQVMNQPAWLKPAQFTLSFGVYALTLVWLLGHFTRFRPAVRLIGAVVAMTSLIDVGLVCLQAARGVPSHFNVATAFDASVYRWMGLSIGMLWLANLVAALLLLGQKFEQPAWGLALRLGLTVTLVGMLAAVPMLGHHAGQPAGLAGAHAVGVPDGGAGLPALGWSSEGGDLRVGHFVGIHGLQVLPLLGWLILRRRDLSVGRQRALVWTAALGQLALTLLLTWQALRGQPLLRPDALTLLAFGLWGAALALSVGLILGWRRRKRQAASLA
ncbi:hypothetical protein [Deinococcus sp. S9]|uniref:hypothetical protein n=1 Tax=Deinococcus sp. S9 TaxID=2545754 RepID=UPI001055CA84|nr:hypothetical protein [Deinococcus sp. S9]TDE85504.1 hypothetical protein E0686_11515 [Deinococcus sp. S9]